MKTPFSLENQTWNNILANNSKAIEDEITDDALTVINNRYYDRCAFVKHLLELGCRSYTIDKLRVVFENENLIQLVYHTLLTVRPTKDASINGEYFISNTWLRQDDEFRLNSVIAQKI